MIITSIQKLKSDSIELGINLIFGNEIKPFNNCNNIQWNK